MAEIAIKEPGQGEAGQLAALLTNDEVLRRDLGFAEHDRPTADDVLRKIVEWSSSRRATVYVVLADNVVIGSISLSHRSPDGQSAQVGYWIGSGYRSRGYCARAFAAVLEQAASEGVASVSATIASDNIPSRRIWERLGAAVMEAPSGQLHYRLKIDHRQEHSVIPDGAAVS